MARQAIAVDKALMVQAVKEVEKNGPLSSEFDLYKSAANWYNGKTQGKEISHSVAMLRIKEWGIEYKTQPARKRQKGISKVAPTITSNIVRIGTLTNIFAPAGEPHFKLKSWKDEDIKEFVLENKRIGEKIGLNYSTNALSYWARMYPPNEPKDLYQCSFIQNLKDKIDSFLDENS